MQIGIDLATLGPIVGVSVIRAGAGWLENVLDEKSQGGSKVTTFEIAQLGGTVVRVGVLSIAGFYAVNGIFGTEITMIASSAGAFVVDFILKKLKSNK